MMIHHFLLFQVVFSDESTISVLDDRVQTVRRRPGEEFEPECLKKTIKHSQKIMVWGAISVHGTSRLKIVEGMMNQLKFVDMLQNRLLPQTRDCFGENPWIFQQDSAPCHTAQSVKMWCRENDVKLLPWPGNSPDMNPIEELWSILKNEIHKVPLTTKHALIERLIYVWFHNDKIKNFCRTLITDMPKRVKALKTAKGRQSKY